MATFNKMFEGKLPKVTSMTDKRKKAVKARASEHGKKCNNDRISKRTSISLSYGA